MTTILTRFSLAVPLILSLNACAVTEKIFNPTSQPGYVTKIYSPQSLAEKVPSCLAGLSRDQIQSKRFAEIQIAHFRGRRWLSAEVQPGMDVSIDDKVEISPWHCKSGEIPVVIKIISKNK
jgi:hypothetical protein